MSQYKIKLHKNGRFSKECKFWETFHFKAFLPLHLFRIYFSHQLNRPPRQTASGTVCDLNRACLPFYVSRYVCLGGSSTPAPSDGSHGYLCSVGHSCPVGSAREVPCEPGTYSPAPGAARCLRCPRGTVCSSSGTKQPLLCPAGKDAKFCLQSHGLNTSV